MKLVKLLTALLLLFSSAVESAKILALFAICTYSHHNLGITLMKELVNRGHEVTFLTCFPESNSIPNLTYVSVAELSSTYYNEKKEFFYELGRKSYWDLLKWIKEYGVQYSELTLTNKNVMDLLNSSKKFDLVVFEHMFNEAFAIFAHKFNCPTVLFAPGPTSEFNNHLVGNPAPAAYVPSLLADFNTKMTFLERAKNLYYSLISQYIIHFEYIPAQNDLLKRVIPDAPDLTTILYNNSLMVTYSHISLQDPVPIQPNIKEVGGYHVQPPKPLPKDIQKYLDSAKDGVVLFTMGSNLKSASFPEDKRKAILNVFSNIKQKVLWKFEADLPEKPRNVKIMKWIPQNDILAHPNVVVFITHGGLLGTTEAVYYGVPVLGLPVMWDQSRNMEEAVRKGYGINLGFEQLNEDNFKQALTELLNNPKYRQNVKRRSEIMRDQPVTPLNEATFWIEYVLRHKGAPHLRPASMDLAWYQIYFLDLFLLVLTMMFVPFALTYLIFKKIVNRSMKKVVNSYKKNK